MNDFEKRLLDIANSTAGKVLNNGEEVQIDHPNNKTYRHFAVIFDSNKQIIEVWKKWIDAYCFTMSHHCDEESRGTKYPESQYDIPILAIRWHKYPKITHSPYGIKVKAYLEIFRIDSDFS